MSFDNVATSGYDGEMDTPHYTPIGAFSGTLGGTLGERGAQWKDTYKVIGDYSGDVLGLPMTTLEFCSFMMLLKLTRFSRSEYRERDCLVDIIGYANLALQEMPE